METIKINRKSKLIRFIDAFSTRLPKDTCELKWMLVTAILKASIVIAVVCAAIAEFLFILVDIFYNIYLWFGPDYGDYVGHPIFLIAGIFTIIYLTVTEFKMIRYRLITERKNFNIPKEKNSPIGDILDSWKEKYCKRIELTND